MKRFKNIITLILIIVSIIGFMKSMKLTAVSEIGVYSNIELNKDEVIANDYLEVTISLHNLASIPVEENGIALVMLSMYYDSSKFDIEYSNVVNNKATISDNAKILSENSINLGLRKDDIIVHVDLDNPNNLSIEILYSLFAIRPLEDDGDIITLKFKAKDKTSGMASFYNMENDRGGNSYIFTSISDEKYSIINTSSLKEVELISNDTGIKSLNVVSLTNNEQFVGIYKNKRFEVIVPSGTTNIEIVVSTLSDGATVLGDGIKTLINSNGSFNLKVIAEDGISTETYSVVIRPMKSINTLMEIELQKGEFIDGTKTLRLDNNVTQYTLNVNYSESLLLTTFVTRSSGAKVYYNNLETSVINLNEINPLEAIEIELLVVAEDSQERIYNFTIIMDLPSDDYSLVLVDSNIDVDVEKQGSIYNLTYEYSLNNKVRLMIKPNNPRTSLEFVNSTLTFTLIDDVYVSEEVILSPGIMKIYEVKATAISGDQNIYTFNLYLEKIDNRTGLNNIYINGEPLVGFEKDIYKYDLGIISHSLEDVLITVDKESENSHVYGVENKIDLLFGADVIVIVVRSQTPYFGEKQNESRYYLSYYRNELDSNNDIENIKVNGKNIEFNKETLVYNLTFEYKLDYVFIDVLLAENSKSATLSGDFGYQELIIGSNKFLIKVESEDEKNLIIYTINIERLGPNINTKLKKVLVDFIEIEPIDESYYLEVDFNVNQIYLDALAFVSETKIDGLGLHVLEFGENIFKIKVENENKTHFTEYEVKILRRNPSSNSYLSELTINGVNLENFEKEQFTYSLHVPWEVLSIIVSAKTEDSGAVIIQSKNQFYERKIDLNTGNNQVLINVEAEDGSVQTYSLIIFRSTILSTNSSLKELEVIGHESFTLDEQESEIKMYSLILPFRDDSIRIKAIPSSSKSFVVGATSYKLNVGLNEIDVIVFAEDTKHYTIYRILVFREALSNNNLIENLSINEKEDFIFDKYTDSYSISLDKEIEALGINVELADKSASYKVIGNNDLKFGTNKIEIKVTAMDQNVKTYTIFVIIAKKEIAKPWIYSALSLGTINFGLIVFAFIQRRKLKL